MRADPITIEWLSRGRPPEGRPDPRFPDGINVDLAGAGAAGCVVPLPYPAACVGAWVIRCSVCGVSVGVTAAGRADDPHTVRIPCKLQGSA